MASHSSGFKGRVGFKQTIPYGTKVLGMGDGWPLNAAV